MKTYFQNLIPDRYKESLQQAYKKRIIIVSSWVLFFTIFISTIVLLPIIFFVQSKKESMTQINKSIKNLDSEQVELISLPSYINFLSQKVISFKKEPSLASKIIEIKNSVGNNINIISINYNKNVKENQYDISISGIAKDRASLINFEKQVSEMSFVEKTTVPVSSFAKDTNLDFSIFLTFKKI